VSRIFVQMLLRLLTDIAETCLLACSFARQLATPGDDGHHGFRTRREALRHGREVCSLPPPPLTHNSPLSSCTYSLRSVRTISVQILHRQRHHDRPSRSSPIPNGPAYAARGDDDDAEVQDGRGGHHLEEMRCFCPLPPVSAVIEQRKKSYLLAVVCDFAFVRDLDEVESNVNSLSSPPLPSPTTRSQRTLTIVHFPSPIIRAL
jgi:hypothetical protein